MNRIKSPNTWTTENQLLSNALLKLDQLIYYTIAIVDKQTASKPAPSEVWEPDFYKEAIKEQKEAKKRQEHADLAADVIKRRDEIRAALSAPRVSSQEPEDYEDVTE